MRLSRVALALLALLAGGCITIFRGVKVTTETPGSRTVVGTRSRAHLLDGSTVLFPTGFRVEGPFVTASGARATRYDLRMAIAESGASIPLDSIAGIESYTATTNTPASVLVSLLGTAGVVVGGAFLAVAIFGSCPTVYADSAGTLALEAEGFSYSIAPVFEARDVDRLRTQPGADGVVRLEVRNEALETHFINQLELLEVRHRRGEVVVPDATGRPLTLGELHPLDAIQDRSALEQTEVLRSSDQRATRSTAALLAAGDSSLSDYLEFDLPVPAGADSVALYLRARNSLLTTVLFYDIMLARQGARAVAWVGDDLNEIGSLTALGRWATAELGLHVRVRENGGWREVGRIADPGPIAWKDLAILIPADGQATRRVRLEYLVDNWRIDRLAAAGAWRRVSPTPVAAARAIGRDGVPDSAALDAVHHADQRYLETHPGDRIVLEFPLPRLPLEEARTLLLVTQGYYTEWIRGSWLARATPSTRFEPGRAALREATQRWARDQQMLEARFYSTRIPVR